MAGFKAQINRDLKTVFHNAEEHADKVKVEYNGKKYNIPVIIDYEGARDRTKSSSDHADGIFIADVRVYIIRNDIKTLPEKNTKISIDGDRYKIIKVNLEAGDIILDLEVYDG